jgi:hypothetical protein
MRWTDEQLREYQARRAARSGNGSGARKEELKDADTRKADNQAGISKVDIPMRAKFRVSVDLFYSDKRRRDGDGAATTLADCIITARRRLLD